MKKMGIGTWADFKALVTSKMLLMQYVDTGSRYEICAPEEYALLWEYSMPKDDGADQVDFETNFKSIANKPLSYRADTERPTRVSSSSQPNNTRQYWEGKTLTIADGDASGSVEFSYTDAVWYVRGGRVRCKDAVFGDNIDVRVYYGEVQICEFVKDSPIADTDWLEFFAMECSKVTSALKVKVIYNKVSTTGVRNVMFVMESFKIIA